MLRFRVLIVGASVAGLHSALFLLSSGLDADVHIVERKRAVGEGIICGGGLGSYMVKKAGIEIPNDFVASKVKKVRFYSPNMDFGELRLEKQYGLVLWRAEWEKWIAERVEELGGNFYFESKAPVQVLSDADVVVGADGLTGITRKMADLAYPPPEDIGMAVQGVVNLSKHPEDTISLFFGSLAQQGYAWIFPLGNNGFRVGLGVPSTFGSQIFSFYRKFLSELDTLSFNPKKIEPVKVKLIPTAKPPKTNVKGNFAFVGDAGCFTCPATGGGIGPAIISAKCLSEALNRGGLEHYDKLWKSKLYRRNKVRYGLKQVLTSFSDGDFELLIKTLKDFKPASESIGWALLHLIVELAVRHPWFVRKHRMIRRLFSGML